MTRTLAEKLGIKEETHPIYLNAPAEAVRAIAPAHFDRASEVVGEFEYVHYFVTTQAELDENFPELRAHIESRGTLWISWPKSGQLGTDLNLHSVIAIGYSHGMVESTCLSVNATWSALKFTHPKRNKVYNNLYGTLIRQDAA